MPRLPLADLLSRILAAMIWEVALQLADAEEPETMRLHAQRMIRRVLAAFRVPR